MIGRTTFSILLGSNLASTSRSLGVVVDVEGFQYPPRIEPRFNHDAMRAFRIAKNSFSILLGSNLASTQPAPNLGVLQNDFQYPPRIEPRFNLGDV